MKFNRTTRRMFLTGAGGAVLAMPLLSSLLPRELRSVAQAGGPRPPRRFLALKTYNGMPVDEFWGVGGTAGHPTNPRDGTLAPTERLSVATGRHASGTEYFARHAPLSDFASSGLSQILTSALAPHYASMNVIRGLDIMPNLNHNHGGFLGNLGLRTEGVGGALPGAQINATIDYVMASSPAVYASAPSGPRVLHLGSRRNTCSYAPSNPSDVLAVGAGSVSRAQAYTDPRAAFLSICPAGPMMGGMPEPSVSTRLLSRVYDDYRRARDGRLLSAADRLTLERHMTYVSELEARMGMTPGLGCADATAPSALDTGSEFEVDVAGIDALWQNMIDVAVLAFSTDSTRIITLDVTKCVIGDGGSTFGMGDSENAASAGRNNWHLQSHNWDDNAQRWLTSGAQWIAERVFGRLLDRMSEVMESDGQSLLHHSLVHWSNELSFNHLNYAIPTVWAGACGGRIETGRYLDYIDWNQRTRFAQRNGSVIEGVQYNRALATIMQAMGLDRTEYERSAGAGFGESRAIDKSPDAWATDYDARNLGDPLPGLFVA